MDKTTNDVAEDQRDVILAGLVARNPRIGAAHRSELVLSNIGDPEWPAEEESLNGNDIRRIDPVVAIHISSSPPASWREKCDSEVMPLRGEHIRGVDARGAWRQSGLARRHGVGHRQASEMTTCSYRQRRSASSSAPAKDQSDSSSHLALGRNSGSR